MEKNIKICVIVSFDNVKICNDANHNVDHNVVFFDSFIKSGNLENNSVRITGNVSELIFPRKTFLNCFGNHIDLRIASGKYELSFKLISDKKYKVLDVKKVN